MTRHDLKIKPKYLTDILNGEKSFEVRYNDRGYKQGDELLLRGFEDGEYTGRELVVLVIYVLEGGQHGLKDDYVIMSINRYYKFGI